MAGIITLFSANSFAQAEVVEAQPETAGAQAGVAGAKQAQAEVVEAQAEGAQAEEVQAQPEVKPEPSVDYYTIGQRFSVDSKVLGNKRNYQIYLPPSYYSQPQANFP
ncbi:MAG: hypothetical protein OIF35_04015, partial [Cellvibrionaceae bacterium]|nr:hypothetical protein [Cellvibrionaceae bacterium]